MKNRTVLALMEQAVMLAVFALAAALCLRIFLRADALSLEGAQRDQALLRAQNAAQVLKSTRGDPDAAAALGGGLADGESWVILYDDQWAQTEDMYTYVLRCTPAEEGSNNLDDYLGAALVEVGTDDRTLASLTVCWQKEAASNG